MRIGSIEITRLRRDSQGELLRPWQMVTVDQLSEESRQLIAKMARAEARSYFEQMKEDSTS